MVTVGKTNRVGHLSAGRESGVTLQYCLVIDRYMGEIRFLRTEKKVGLYVRVGAEFILHYCITSRRM